MHHNTACKWPLSFTITPIPGSGGNKQVLADPMALRTSPRAPGAEAAALTLKHTRYCFSSPTYFYFQRRNGTEAWRREMAPSDSSTVPLLCCSRLLFRIQGKGGREAVETNRQAEVRAAVHLSSRQSLSYLLLNERQSRRQDNILSCTLTRAKRKWPTLTQWFPTWGAGSPKGLWTDFQEVAKSLQKPS